MDSKVITVIPVYTGAGGKFISTNLAFALASKLGKSIKVALVDFNFKYPYLAEVLCDVNNQKSIDNLIPSIDGEVLSEELFNDNLIKLGNQDFNLDLLKGTKKPQNYNYFEDKHILTLLKYLKNTYNYIIINVDGNFDNAGTVTSVSNSDIICVVANNNIQSQHYLTNILNKLVAYGGDKPVNVILNKANSDISHVDLVGLCQKEGLPVIGVIPYSNSSVDNLDLKTNPSNMYGKPRFGVKPKLTELYGGAILKLIE